MTNLVAALVAATGGGAATAVTSGTEQLQQR